MKHWRTWLTCYFVRHFAARAQSVRASQGRPDGLTPNEVKNDLRCATGTSTPLAQIKRKSSANQRANHFPKDVRSIGNGAQTILPAAQTILPRRANHFAPRANHFAVSRKPFWLVKTHERTARY